MEAVDLLEEREAITDPAAVAELYDLAKDCYDGGSLIEWLETNRPDLLSKKYSRAATKFIRQGEKEFKERIFYICLNIFPPPKGDVKMTKEQIQELNDLGFTAHPLIAGKSRFQAQYIINYWKSLKEYFDVMAHSYFDEFYSIDFTPSKGEFFAGFEESGQALHAYLIKNRIRCYACGYFGNLGEGSCPICGTAVVGMTPDGNSPPERQQANSIWWDLAKSIFYGFFWGMAAGAIIAATYFTIMNELSR